MDKNKLQKIPKDGEVVGLRHAVIFSVIFLLGGPGCGAVLGSMYGSAQAGAIAGALLVGFAAAVTLPTLLNRGMRR